MGIFTLERDHRETSEATDVLARTRSTVDPALRAAVDTLPESMGRIAGYHFGWWEADGASASSAGAGGKAIRPALVLSATHAVGGSPAGRARRRRARRLRPRDRPGLPADRRPDRDLG